VRDARADLWSGVRAAGDDVEADGLPGDLLRELGFAGEGEESEVGDAHRAVMALLRASAG
jgi:hypothetical protein